MSTLIHIQPEGPGCQPAEPAYLGESTPLGRTVVVEDRDGRRALPLGDGARGYAWGRAGTGPRELARAILIDATANEMLAERLCRPLTWEVVSKLPSDGFLLKRTEILAWVDAQGGPGAEAA